MPRQRDPMRPTTIVRPTSALITKADWESRSDDFKLMRDGTPMVVRLSDITGATELVPVEIVEDLAAVDVAPDALAAEVINQIVAQLPNAVLLRSFTYSRRREGWIFGFFPWIARSAVVEYVRGRDLYDVVVHDTTNTGASIYETRHDGVACDQLRDLLARPPRGRTAPLFEPVPFKPQVTVTGWDDLDRREDRS